jgi:hypothetical protein
MYWEETDKRVYNFGKQYVTLSIATYRVFKWRNVVHMNDFYVLKSLIKHNCEIHNYICMATEIQTNLS